MSLITKDFRYSKNQAQKYGFLRLRWLLLAMTGAGIGVVIASTHTESSHQTDTDALPAFKSVTRSSEELARESFSLGLPELQAQQKIIDDANNQSPRQWREFEVKSGDPPVQTCRYSTTATRRINEVRRCG